MHEVHARDKTGDQTDVEVTGVTIRPKGTSWLSIGKGALSNQENPRTLRAG